MGQVTFINVQTTGIGRDETHYTVEVSAEVYVDGKHDLKQSFTQLLNPQREITIGASALHGHTNESLQGQPLFSSIAERFKKLIDESEHLVMHCSFAVKPILQNEFARLGQSLEFKAPIFDTFHQASAYFGRDTFTNGRGLENLYQHFVEVTMPETRQGDFHADKKVVKLHAVVEGMVKALVADGRYDALKEAGKIKPEHEQLFQALALVAAPKAKLVKRVSFAEDEAELRKHDSDIQARADELKQFDEKHPGVAEVGMFAQSNSEAPMTRARAKAAQEKQSVVEPELQEDGLLGYTPPGNRL